MKGSTGRAELLRSLTFGGEGKNWYNEFGKFPFTKKDNKMKTVQIIETDNVTGEIRELKLFLHTPAGYGVDVCVYTAVSLRNLLTNLGLENEPLRSENTDSNGNVVLHYKSNDTITEVNLLHRCNN